MNEQVQIEQPSAEEIARYYAAAMDSVNLINGDKPEFTSDEDWADTLERNAAHLEIMVAKDYWTTENLTPFTAAIAKARA
jgi:hypothetical protein